YLNVAGGMRIQEPAGDLAAAAALVSSFANEPLPADAVYFGEGSLSGAVRPVAPRAAPLKGAAKLGVSRALAPETIPCDRTDSGLKIIDVASLANLVADIRRRRQGTHGCQNSWTRLVTAPRRPAIYASKPG